MPKNKKWSHSENELLTGVIREYGDKPREWPEDVKEMVKANLKIRSEHGIYQQALKLIKSRAMDTDDSAGEFMMAQGA